MDAVAPDIEQRPAAHAGVAPVVVLTHLHERKRRPHQTRLAQVPTAHQTRHFLLQRVVAVHERFRQYDPVVHRRFHHLLRLLRVESQRLLTQDMLAVVHRLDRPPEVQVVRQRQIDRVHLVVGDQRVIIPIRRHVGPD